LELEQRKTLERLAIVAVVLTLVIVTAYLVYRPGEKKAVKSPDRIPILAAQKRAILALFSSGRWFVDANANEVWDGAAGGDSEFAMGNAGDIPLAGFWEGSSAPSVGVYKDGTFSLLIQGKIVTFNFGGPGDLPVLGDWNGDGHTKIGIFNKGFWSLDMKGDGQRVDPPAGQLIALGGTLGETPVVGDWNGDGRTKVGVYNNGAFSLDFDGSGIWDKNDKIYYFGEKGDIPVVGDWNGDGRTKVGVFHKGFWLLDYNGDGKWTGPPQDRVVAVGGAAGEIPVVGDWNGDGRSKVGVYQPPDSFHLDSNGNGVWEETDKMFSFGPPGSIPVILQTAHSKK
jgi:hypothetical protein